MLIHEQDPALGTIGRIRQLLARKVVSVARPSRSAFFDAIRRAGWLTHRVGAGQVRNLLQCARDFAFGRERVSSLPALVKIDISPLCNLKCTACVHADPGDDQTLRDQHFHAGQTMSVEDYRRLIRQLQHRTSAVSLYYLGDPLVHPQLEELCGIAFNAGLNVHLSTNLSFGLSDARVDSIVCSGVTHFTVCIDGMTQESYQKTRVGGRLERVIDNLRRLCRARERLRRSYPKIEVQFIKYRHNEAEVEQARDLCAALGVDQFTVFWGNLHNYVDRRVENYRVGAPKRALVAGTHCYWPSVATLVKYDGDVIPCCNHRLDEQYSRSIQSPVLGNVFEEGIEAVWASPAYERLRRFVKNPRLVESDPTLAESFCYGCVRLFETTCVEEAERPGDQYRYEDLYGQDGRGRPVRRRLPVADDGWLPR